MHFRTIATLSGVLILAHPVTASAGEPVEFSFQKEELASPTGRTLLLERMDTISHRACTTNSPFETRQSVKRCVQDVEAQFIEAIADERLSRQWRDTGEQSIRTARR